MPNRCVQVADAHEYFQNATCASPPHDRAEDTPLRYARTLAAGAS